MITLSGEVAVDPPQFHIATPAEPQTEVLALPVAGPPGQNGTAGASYTHVQNNAAATWTIHHGLSGYPAVTVFLSNDPHRPVWTDTEYPDSNTAVLTFPSPVTGQAFL